MSMKKTGYDFYFEVNSNNAHDFDYNSNLGITLKTDEGKKGKFKITYETTQYKNVDNSDTDLFQYLMEPFAVYNTSQSIDKQQGNRIKTDGDKLYDLTSKEVIKIAMFNDYFEHSRSKISKAIKNDGVKYTFKIEWESDDDSVLHVTLKEQQGKSLATTTIDGYPLS